ncbi:MAG: peptidylprolyl isomerase [Paludibacteraceae bacterium]|nr:peptidylprolyl isomerase [Paludibacteraceae bacterium]
MKRAFVFIISLLSAGMLFSQTVMKIAGNDVSKEEFEYYYNKNNVGDATKLSVGEYTDLFIKFKLKVAEAYNRKMDTISSYKNEINGYRERLVRPYLTDNAAKDSLVQEAYNRLLEDVDVSHILIRSAGANDSLSYSRAKEALKKLESENFEKVAVSMSDDKASAQDSGRLGWITGMTTVYPFECAAYNTKVGEHSGIIKSGYGYHIVKVNARRPSRGQVKIAHIFKRNFADFTQHQQDSLKNVVFGVYEKLQSGENFEELAKSESEDLSGKNGGELPWLTTGRTNELFENAAFAIKNVGDISEPIEAPYGWHIIKLLDKKPIDSLSVLKSDLESRIGSDERSKIISDIFIAKLRKEYGFNDSISDAEVYEYEKDNLEKKYPNFGLLMKEYRDGILMFNICQEEIWNKAAKDTAGLRKYFETHKENYKYSAPRYKGIVVRCASKDIKRKAQRMLGSVPMVAAYDMLLTLNTDEAKNVRIERGVYPEGKNAMVDYYIFNKGKLPSDSKYPESFVIGKIQKEYPDSYKDVKGAVLNDYQNQVEAEWINKLRKKYPVEIYQEVMDAIK